MPINQLYEKLNKQQKLMIDEVVNRFELDFNKCKAANIGVCNVNLVPTLLVECEGKCYNTGISLEDIKL